MGISTECISGPRPFVLAIGDSLTAGYGVQAADGFVAQLQQRLRLRQTRTIVQDAGVSGNTSANALARLPRLLSSLNCLPDLAIVELGANDLLRGIALDATRANLDAIVQELKRCGIPVLLAAMEAPRFLGGFAQACDALYADLAAKHDIAIWPFFPPGVLGNPTLTLRDGMHPNARAIALIADHMAPAVLSAFQLGRDAEIAA